MKTLADFKRRLVIGTRLRVTFHLPPLVIRGNLGNTVMPTPEPEERVVAKVQSNSVALRCTPCFNRTGFASDP